MTKATFDSMRDRIVDADRHIDVQGRDKDERMHTTPSTPLFHASDIANVPACKPVQIGNGGWHGSRAGMKLARGCQLMRGRARDGGRSSASCSAGTLTS